MQKRRKYLIKETDFIQSWLFRRLCEGYAHRCLVYLYRFNSQMTTENTCSSAPGRAHPISTSCPRNASWVGRYHLLHVPSASLRRPKINTHRHMQILSSPLSALEEATVMRYTYRIQTVFVKGHPVQFCLSERPPGLRYLQQHLPPLPATPATTAICSITVSLQRPHHHHPQGCEPQEDKALLVHYTSNCLNTSWNIIWNYSRNLVTTVEWMDEYLQWLH